MGKAFIFGVLMIIMLALGQPLFFLIGMLLFMVSLATKDVPLSGFGWALVLGLCAFIVFSYYAQHGLN